MALKTSRQSMTGADLKAERKAAGLSQAKLASLAGILRLSVCYWEKKPIVGRRYDWAENRILKVLYVYVPSTRALGDRVIIDRFTVAKNLKWAVLLVIFQNVRFRLGRFNVS